MKIRLLHTKQCHAWHEAENQLKEALKETGLTNDYEVVLLVREDDAKKYHFSGSPQITVDGNDVDPMAKNITNFSISSCRPYFFKGKFYDFPPKEMILEKLKGIIQFSKSKMG